MQMSEARGWKTDTPAVHVVRSVSLPLLMPLLTLLVCRHPGPYLSGHI